MKQLICALLALSLVFGMAACEPQAQSQNMMENVTPNTELAVLTSGEEEPLIMDFYVRLFRECYEQDKNTLISPMSILQALAMTANGAEGETLHQMEAVFGVNLDMLNNSAIDFDDGTGNLHIANSIWFRDSDNFTVNQEFLQTNADHYGAGIYKAPFDEQTCKEINNWVKENTHGMIPSILEEIPPEALMYLINALAFEAKWQSTYQEHQIREGSFTTQWGYRRDVEMMYAEESLYLADEYATGFIKPYEGGRYAFVALLPEPDVTVEEYLENLTGEHLHELLSNPYEAKVRTAMPQFQVEYDLELSKILKTMGMTDAFNPNKADFDGIGHSGLGNLYISQVLHKTFIQVDAQGTRAGAATAVTIAPGSAQPEPDFYQVYLDRPFVYMIIDTEYHCPLFMGTMMDPTGEEVMPIAEEPLSEPPELFVRCGDCDCHMAVLSGNYWWEGPAVNGQTGAVIACGSHPLDGTHTKDFTTVTGDWLTLAFPVWPDEITVRRWPGTEIGNTDHWGEEMTLDGKYLAVEDGDWVYQIDATWNRDTWKGSAEYHLYISK